MVPSATRSRRSGLNCTPRFSPDAGSQADAVPANYHVAALPRGVEAAKFAVVVLGPLRMIVHGSRTSSRRSSRTACATCPAARSARQRDRTHACLRRHRDATIDAGFEDVVVERGGHVETKP